jgi:uncharacterized protein
VKSDLEARARQGQNALMVASVAGHVAVVELLAASKASLDRTDEIGQSALIKAVISGRPSVCRALLAEGCDANSRDDNGKILCGFLRGIFVNLSAEFSVDVSDNF